MGRRKDTPVIVQQKFGLLDAALRGRSEASSAQLSRSFGLKVEDVRRVLRSKGIYDNG